MSIFVLLLAVVLRAVCSCYQFTAEVTACDRPEERAATGAIPSGEARFRFLDSWLHRAMYSRIEPIKKVARMLRDQIDGVVGWVQW